MCIKKIIYTYYSSAQWCCLQGVSDDPALIDADDPFAAQDRAEHDKMVAIAKGFEAKYVCLYLFYVI